MKPMRKTPKRKILLVRKLVKKVMRLLVILLKRAKVVLIKQKKLQALQMKRNYGRVLERMLVLRNLPLVMKQITLATSSRRIKG
jgi:hypothetical protein